MKFISTTGVAMVAVVASTLLGANPAATTAEAGILDYITGSSDAGGLVDLSNPFPVGSYCGSYMAGLVTARITMSKPPAPSSVETGVGHVKLHKVLRDAEEGGSSSVSASISVEDAEAAEEDENDTANAAAAAALSTIDDGHLSVMPTFDLSVQVMKNKFFCPSISYVLDQATGHASVPDATNPRTCLGSLLASRSLGLAVEYHGGQTNQIKLGVGIANVWLSQCE